MIIDVHAHHFPPSYFAYLKRFGPTGPFREEDLATRLRMMEEAGVSRQVLSPTRAPYLEGEAEGVHAARELNDTYAGLCWEHPKRFSFWCSPPLPHVDPALREIARSYDELGAVGVTLHCACLGVSIADARFETLYAELDRRRAVVFLHPCQNGLCSPLLNDWGLTVCAGASMEDAVAAMHLIVCRIPERFPNIRFIVPHLGGILPMLLNRLDGQMPQADLLERPSVTARRFFYDTVGWGSKAALICAAEAFGASQLVTGSDWPILLPWESYAQTFRHIAEAGLPPADVDRILHRNVHALLNLDA